MPVGPRSINVKLTVRSEGVPIALQEGNSGCMQAKYQRREDQSEAVWAAAEDLGEPGRREEGDSWRAVESKTPESTCGTL